MALPSGRANGYLIRTRPIDTAQTDEPARRAQANEAVEQEVGGELELLVAADA